MVVVAFTGAAAEPTSRPATGPAEGEIDEALRTPITYFNANCSSCHGNYGSYWGEGFAAELSEEELHAVVDEMAAGPAFAPLEGRALEAQTAYNRSLAAGAEKGLFVVAIVQGATVTGEVTPEATVTVVTGAGDVKATVDGHTWAAEVGEATVTAVHATRGERTATVKLGDSQAVGWATASEAKE